MLDTRIQEIFDRISDIEIDLDPDPISRGPKYLNALVAMCRNVTTEVQVFEREVAKEKMRLDRDLNRDEASYELQFNDLLTNDPTVLAKTSVRDREACVKDTLSPLMQSIRDIKIQQTDLGHVATVIKSKLQELKDVNRDIRLQMRLIEDEIKLGNYWGDQSEDGQHLVEPKEMDLDDILPAALLGTDTNPPPESYDAEGTDAEGTDAEGTDSNKKTEPDYLSEDESRLAFRELERDFLGENNPSTILGMITLDEPELYVREEPDFQALLGDY